MISRLVSKMQKAMKKNYILGALAVAAMTLVSCNKEQDVIAPEVAPEVSSEGIPFVISAGAEETKTTNTDNTVKWAVDDQIALWHAETTTTTYVADGIFEAATAAASSTFSGNLASALDPAKSYDWYAIYPYQSGVNTPEAYNYVTIGSAAASAQVQDGYNNKTHLSGVAFPLYGKVSGVAADTKPEIGMKHIASVIEFVVTNNYADPVQIQQIQFSSSAAADLIGTYQVNFADGSATLTTATTNSVATLNVDTPVDLANTESAKFYMAIKPFSLVAGQTLTVTVKTNEGTQVLSNVASGSFTFAPGKIHTLNVSFTNKTSNLAQFLYNDGDWLDGQGITKPASGAGTALVDGEFQTVGDLSVGAQKLTGSQPMLWNNGGTYEFRAYKKNKIVVGSTNGKVITKITFTGTAMTKTSADVGTFSASNKFWTGRSNQVLFTLADDSARNDISTINVFYESAEDSEHMLSVPVTSLSVDWDATSVYIPLFAVNPVGLSATSTSPGYTSNTPDAGGITVNFSTNTASTPRDIVVNIQSTNPVVDQNVTITQGGKVINVSNISGIKAAYDTEGAEVNFSATVSEATVTLLDGSSNFYLQDATGAVLVYTGSHGLNAGDKITGTVSGSIKKYNSNYEIVSFAYDAGDVTSGAAPSPTSVAIGTLMASDDAYASYESKYVKVSSLTVTAVDGQNLSVAENANLKIYNKSGFTLPVGSQFNAAGAVGYRNAQKQITMVSLADEDKISIVPTITASNASVSVGGTVTISPTSNSSGTFTFESLTPAKATVDANTGEVTGVEEGSATIRIHQAAKAGTYWGEGSKDITVTVTNTTYEWVEVTSLANITSGEYVIINNNKYLPSTTTTSSPVQADAPTVTAGKIADANVTAAMKWTFSGTSSAMNITNSESKHLCINGKSNTSLRVTTPTNPSNTWVFETNDSAFAMKYYDTDTTPAYRYCATYAPGTDWRTYNSATASNYGDGGKIHVYKKTVKSE